MAQTGVGYEFIGATAGILTTFSFVPQVVKVLRERATAAISLRMYLAFTVGTILWLTYGILIRSLSVTLANLVTLFLAGAVLAMKLHLDYGFANPQFQRERAEREQR